MITNMATKNQSVQLLAQVSPVNDYNILEFDVGNCEALVFANHAIDNGGVSLRMEVQELPSLDQILRLDCTLATTYYQISAFISKYNQPLRPYGIGFIGAVKPWPTSQRIRVTCWPAGVGVRTRLTINYVATNEAP